MSHTLTETSTFQSTITVPDDGDSITAASVNSSAFQGLANRTTWLNGQNTTNVANINEDRRVSDGSALCAIFTGMPWYPPEILNSSHALGSAFCAASVWRSPLGYLTGWAPSHIVFEWDGSASARMVEINSDGVGNSTPLSIVPSLVTAVEHALVAPISYGASRTSVTNVAYFKGTYASNYALMALKQGDNSPYFIRGTAATATERPIGCGYNATLGQVLLVSDSAGTYGNRLYYATTTTTFASQSPNWPYKTDASPVLSYPLTYTQRPWVPNTYSLGPGATSTAYPWYWWGKSVADSTKLVLHVFDHATQTLSSQLSPTFGVNMTHVDVYSVQSGISFLAGGDGTTLKVTFNPQTGSSMSVSISYTPPEPFVQVMCMVYARRKLVGLLGQYTHEWNFYDVTNGSSAVPFVQRISCGGAIYKQLPGFGAYNSMHGARGQNGTLATAAIGYVSDSRLNWSAPHDGM